ncbi:hypothetical protein C791_6297 [Amycolatopsis azurea DSM 43854]|uniref:Uncharacterized protein n=1 Tax=Amycolatopsis azurea DSM 43854 TaxID=1238180 RepID=M2NPN1_9PSEU|nr:hypothetical protein C791_6297 [Amycolatopsis azurea DSM 43854]
MGALREALATYREIRHPAAERVEARLAKLLTQSTDQHISPHQETEPREP